MKTCQANNCSYPVFSHNFCKTHQWLRKDSDYDSRTPMQKYQDSLKKIKDRRENDDLQKYFEFHMEHSEMVCENCGANLSGLTEKEWKGCQHHVLEKSLFPSVRAELINHAVLGYYCCHGQFHSSYKNAMQMPIWNTLVERVQPILHLVKEKHKILELFKLDEVKNQIT